MSAVIETSDTPEATSPGRTRLVLEGLSKRFGGVKAVDDVSFAVPPQEIRGIIGPNGAGKTTLFDMIAGAQRATAGTVVLDGTDVTAASASKRARLGVRRTFQRQQPIGWLSVEDNVLCALEWRGGGGGMVGDLLALPGRRRIERRRRDDAQHMLELCGLSELRQRQASELSIGQARRLELARAVVDEPKLLLLDEPTSGLEESEVEVFAEIVRDVRVDTSCSVLLIEHDVPFVMALCDQVMVMELGKVFAEGTPDEVKRNKAVRDAYLG
jgi:branched-chain amino acid transport system ATP-binding protein